MISHPTDPSYSQPSQSHWLRTHWRWAVLIVLAIAARVLACVAFAPDRFDVDQYQAIASTLAEHGVYGTFPHRPTAFRPPLYPVTLALLGPAGKGARLRIVALQVLLGVGTVLITYRIAYRLNAPPTLAALLVAVDPILLRQSTAAMTEPMAAMLATLGLLCLVNLGGKPSWKRGLATGLVLGLASLCRPTFVIWSGLVVVWLSLRSLRDKEFRAATLSLALGTAVMIAPWTARNYVVLGHPIFATTHGGYTLWLGNNPLFYDHLRRHGPARPWDSSDLDAYFASLGEEFDHDERRVDRECYRRATAAIANDPNGFALSSIVRAARLFQPIPNRLSDTEGNRQRMVRYAIGAWYILAGVGLLTGLWSLRRKIFSGPNLPTLLLVLAFVGLHTFYWSNMRMRAPLMPALSVLVAVGWNRWLVRRKVREGL